MYFTKAIYFYDSGICLQKILEFTMIVSLEYGIIRI